MAQGTVFLLCSWAHAMISITESCLFLNAVKSECLKITSIQRWLSALAPVQRFLRIIRIVWRYEIFKVFAILHWGTFFWNCATIWRPIFANWWTSANFTSEKHCLCMMLISFPIMSLACCQLNYLAAKCSSLRCAALVKFKISKNCLS